MALGIGRSRDSTGGAGENGKFGPGMAGHLLEKEGSGWTSVRVGAPEAGHSCPLLNGDASHLPLPSVFPALSKEAAQQKREQMP